MVSPTRVGVYVDAFNVYYGARAQCGRGTPGWRWLDLANLAFSLIKPSSWPDPELTRLVYCTALRDREGDPSSLADQQTYLSALSHEDDRVIVAHGKFVPRTKSGILVDRETRPPLRVPSPGTAAIPAWLPVEEVTGTAGEVELLATVSTFEEKGSDVNVASHLLHDVFNHEIDAAMVFSNDSDLKYPLALARDHVPVATVNPGNNPTPIDLRGDPHSGVGRHWWRRLKPTDFYKHQFADRVGPHVKPVGW